MLREFEDHLKYTEWMIREVRLANQMVGRLDVVRFSHETTIKTLDRIIAQAQKTICPDCRGSRTNIFDDTPCRKCHGTGERPYDPFIDKVNDVMNE
jgi:hypothetical protein